MFNRVLLFATLLLYGCGIPQEDYDLLQAKVKELEQQLDECKFGASRLLKEAAILDEKQDYERCLKVLDVLLSDHPSSNEADQAKELHKQVSIKIDNQKKAELEKARKEKLRISNMLNSMRKKHDDIEGITWYYDRSSPKYLNSRNAFYAYFGKREDEKPFLRFVIQYVASDWLFIDKFIIKVDGKKYVVQEDRYGEIKKDNASGQIWEWIDRRVKSNDLTMLKVIANGKNVKIRFSGQQYHKDRVISSKEKQALKNVIDAYESLSGT